LKIYGDNAFALACHQNVPAWLGAKGFEIEISQRRKQVGENAATPGIVVSARQAGKRRGMFKSGSSNSVTLDIRHRPDGGRKLKRNKD
jgi:hypothetical protein